MEGRWSLGGRLRCPGHDLGNESCSSVCGRGSAGHRWMENTPPLPSFLPSTGWIPPQLVYFSTHK